ncbi:hypothetical protein [Dietzia cercidiphylli]|uniref:hypothetical protein n=1 Tax=Dietzia cercidiphylli TaxID=498199 RepID=UPI00223B2914|nr:hypothetical protein [Dietzia cercidiphylli]MCT1515295.1 hypothetical protein [Dietzia cercidiphylli]
MTTAPSTTGSPVQRWRSTAPWLPPLESAAATAEGLLLALHYSVNFDGWIGTRRQVYWDKILPARIRRSTYRTNTLDWWWSDVCVSLEAEPGSRALRRDVAELLRSPEAREVLDILRREHVALVLRVRLIADAVRESKTSRESGEGPTDE